MNAPFLVERMKSSVRNASNLSLSNRPGRGPDSLPKASLLAAPIHDECVGTLVVAGLVAPRGLTPGRHRMPPARSLALAAAVRMVDRVHRNAAVVGTLSEPAG